MKQNVLSKQGGFTLLELLVAMVLMATVITALFGLFTCVIDASEQISRKIDGGQVKRAVLSIVADDMRFVHTELASKQYRFVIKPSSSAFSDNVVLTFTTSSSLDYRVTTAQGDLQDVEYVLRRASDRTYSFVRRERRHATISGNFEWMDFELMDGLSDINIEPYDQDAKEFKHEWGVERAGLPAAVRFTFTPKDEDSDEKWTILVNLPSETL